MGMKEMGLEMLAWAQHREQRRPLEYIAMNLRVRYKEGNFLSSCATVRFLRKFVLHRFDLCQ
jgi:hypothetical protein